MRLLLFFGVLAVIGLIITGAITLSRSDDNTITIQINKSQVKEDAAEVVEKGKDVISDAKAVLREAARKRNEAKTN